MRASGRFGVLVGVWLAVSLGFTGGVGANSVASSVADRPAFQVEQPTPTNNTTRHADPRNLNQQGDLAGVRRWLAGRMTAELEDCVVEVGLGSTDVCEYEDEYPSWLDKYVDVAEETDGEDDDERGEAFDAARNESQAYDDAVSEFSETQEAYRGARAAGDEERARRLARELIRDAQRVNQTSERLFAITRVLEQEPGVDLSDAKVELNRTRANVTAIVSEIAADQFVDTRLRATITPRTISFLTPGAVSGRLVTENGSPVPSESITITVGGRAFSTRTDADGRFTFEYRPVKVSAAAEQLSVVYRPRNTSVYLASETTVNLSISQVKPAVAVEVEPTTARFGDEIGVSGMVSADGTGAGGVPVVVTIDGRTVGTVRTGSEGRFSLRTAIAAADGPGDVTVAARLPLEARALAAANGSTGLRIRETATELAINARASSSAVIEVTGSLGTVDGDVIPDRPVVVSVNGTELETVRTDGNGRFQVALDLPASLRGSNRTVTVQARFVGSGTNLESANATASVTVPAARGAPDESAEQGTPEASGENPLAYLLALVGFLVIAGSTFLLHRRGAFDDWFDRDSVPTGGAAGETVAESSSPSPPPDDHSETLLAAARERLGVDTDRAVMLAYSTVRDALMEPGGSARRDAETHWEFLRACRQDGLDDSTLDSLTQLTEAYEQAAYAPVSIARVDAESVLDAADSVV